jgi:hypothetical protein
MTTDFQSLPEDYQYIIQLAQETYKITVSPLQLLVGGWSGRRRLSCQRFIERNETRRALHPQTGSQRQKRQIG